MSTEGDQAHAMQILLDHSTAVAYHRRSLVEALRVRDRAIVAAVAAGIPKTGARSVSVRLLELMRRRSWDERDVKIATVSDARVRQVLDNM